MTEETSTVDQLHTAAEQAILAIVNVTAWSGRRLDKAASRDVEDRNGAKTGSTSVRKQLIDKKYLDPINKVVNEIRGKHYHMTLPWSDRGHRLLTTAQYHNYTTAMYELFAKFNNAVDEFLRNYPQYQQEAAEDLGELYDPEAYPTMMQLRGKFTTDMDFMPVPVGKDLRVTLGEDALNTIQKKIDDTAQARIAEAQKASWRRAYDAIHKLGERLSDPEARFKQGLVDNVVELCDLLPGLNPAGDPRMTQMANILRQRFAGLDSKTLRKNPEEREKAANTANKLAEALKLHI